MTGTGPVDAVYKGIDLLTGVSVNLETYSLNSVSEGIEALATTKVVITPSPEGHHTSTSTHAQTGITKNKKFSGSGSDTDVVIASGRAHVSALNKLLSWRLRRKNQIEDDDSSSANDAVLVEDGKAVHVVDK